MDESQFLKRKIFLKKQLIGLLNDEIEDLRDRSNLLRLKERLEDKLKEHGFDSVLSRKIDCIHYLLEN
jgi:hypothetical protein